jgi:hypothetical protein
MANVANPDGLDVILQRLFYDEELDAKTIPKLYKEARKVTPFVRIKDVKEWIHKQSVYQNRVATRNPRYNSFVAQEPRQEFQVDVADFGKTEPKYALFCVDIFTKYIGVEVLPMVRLGDKTGKRAAASQRRMTEAELNKLVPSKEPIDTARAMDKLLDRMDLPASIMTDEGGEFKGSFDTLLNTYDIEHLRVRTHPRFAERAIRSIKDRLATEIEAKYGRGAAKNFQHWHEIIQREVKKYNAAVNPTIQRSPDNAVANAKVHSVAVRNDIKQKLEDHARFRNKRPTLSVTDDVRIRDIEAANSKGPSQQWTNNIYEITSVKNTANGPLFALKYKAGPDEVTSIIKRPFFRHELLKVSGAYEGPGADNFLSWEELLRDEIKGLVEDPVALVEDHLANKPNDTDTTQGVASIKIDEDDASPNLTSFLKTKYPNQITSINNFLWLFRDLFKLNAEEGTVSLQ